jgi:hypothetical protein
VVHPEEDPVHGPPVVAGDGRVARLKGILLGASVRLLNFKKKRLKINLI